MVRSARVKGDRLLLVKGWIGRRLERSMREKKVCEKLREAKMTVGEETSVNDVFKVFKEVVMTVAQEVVGYRVCKDRVKGSAWWTDEIKGTVEENVLEELSVRRRTTRNGRRE